jgi:hypothetical protein
MAKQRPWYRRLCSCGGFVCNCMGAADRAAKAVIAALSLWMAGIGVFAYVTVIASALPVGA